MENTPEAPQAPEPPIEAPLLVDSLEEPEGPPIEGPEAGEPVKKKELKEKKHRKLGKKAKFAIIISSAVVGLAAVGVLLYFLVLRKEEPEVVLTDRDILVSHAWEKQEAPTVIWTFRADGTGEITTNKSNYYDMTWYFEQDGETQTLKINTAWLYELNDSFTFALDRENNSFTVKNLADEGESVFVPLGTAEQQAAEQSEEQTDELEKTE